MCLSNRRQRTVSRPKPHARVPGKLAHARAPFCVAVLVMYGGLSWRGFRHVSELLIQNSSSEKIVHDFTLLVALYGAETVGAVLFGVSTLYGWSRRHFLEHHLPLVVLFVLMASQQTWTSGRALDSHKEWMALVLLISFNECSAALLTVYPSPRLNKLRVLPNMMVQVALFGTETTSWFRATTRQLTDRDPNMWVCTLLTQFLLCAAIVHLSYLHKLSKLFQKLFLAKD